MWEIWIVMCELTVVYKKPRWGTPLRECSSYILGCLASEGPQWELLQYPFGFGPKKYYRWPSVILELVPLRGEKNSKPLTQNKILVPPRCSFQNFRGAPLFFVFGRLSPRVRNLWNVPNVTSPLLESLSSHKRSLHNDLPGNPMLQRLQRWQWNEETAAMNFHR